MKMRLGILAAVLTAAFLAQGCAGVLTPYQALPGGLYSDMSSPGNATTGGALGSKMGTGMAESYLGFVAMGDASLSAAATSAGITKITHWDYKSWSVAGLYAKLEVYVYGE